MSRAIRISLLPYSERRGRSISRAGIITGRLATKSIKTACLNFSNNAPDLLDARCIYACHDRQNLARGFSSRQSGVLRAKNGSRVFGKYNRKGKAAGRRVMVSATGTATVVTLVRTDPVFARLRAEAEEAVRKEPDIAGFMFSAILNLESLEAAIIHRLAARLGHNVFPSDLIEPAYFEAIATDPSIPEAFRADIAAVVDRDPACTRLIEPVLYFKGFHAIETHRLAHALWNAGRQDFALYLQSRSSEVFQTDIHPAARIGKGIFLDHATGLVVGATAAIGDNVSMLQDVTLGGTGKERGDRHPKIKHGVLI